MEARRCTPAENHFKPLHVRVYIAISFANPTLGSNCGRARRKYVGLALTCLSSCARTLSQSAQEKDEQEENGLRLAHHAQYDLHAVRMSSERRDKLSGGL
ncbi:hypothetical protein V1477_006912 [Vespula maculifrons]|uniref:Uncharacterized protein n=1 Tax=Vespula maculifrons TaxID=7453 RepID=A0ABD2CHT6_VESMC